MRVSIIKTKNIKNIMLPNLVRGSFWISDTDGNGIKRNLISIEADNGKWKLCSNKEVYYLNNNKVEPFVYLDNNRFYNVRNEVEKINYLIYTTNNETKYKYYEVSNYLENGISIGNSENTLIRYKHLEELACTIKKENDKIYVIDNTSKYGVYVNNIRVFNKKELKTGDIIFIIGLKLVFLMMKKSDKIMYYLGIAFDFNDLIVKLQESNLPMSLDSKFTESEEETEFPLWDESEYFYKAPRFVNQVKTLELKVDDPPTKVDQGNNSLLLTIGPMITMSMTSLVTAYTALNNVQSGGTTWERAMPSLVIAGAMFASIFIWPIFSKGHEKRARKKSEKERQKKYSEYIEIKRQSIIEAKTEQTRILKNSYSDLKESNEIILRRFMTLWQRRTEDSDFLEVNLGNGSYEMKIDIKYPEEHFSMIEDNLKDMVTKLGSEPKMLTGVPVVFSFIQNYISGLIGESEVTSEYAKRLLVQILAHHSYDNLKTIVLTDEENEYKWKFLKNIPHCFTDDKALRFYATNNDEYKEVCYYLSKIFEKRKEELKEPKIEDMNTLYLIITDSFKKIKDFDIIDSILQNKKNYGFSLFILDKKITNLPDQCKAFINIDRNKGEIHNSTDVLNVIQFNTDLISEIDYEKISKKLINIPIEFKNSDEGQLPNKIGFLEMYDVGKIDQLNSGLRWQNSNPMLNLQAPIGIGKNGEKIAIDLHEKYHGPHGLIAGMTGSGKSELIITYILSMALNYHPYEVQFILIDYKGGGLAGAFENSNIGLKLPHLVGTITNLDANEIKRSLASIESELKRRQALFNKAREASGESTIDIYKYQKMYRDKIVNEPISHLFIISDEFAELKNQQPEFMEQLISTARIGRSLGVHLILATQKPSGVVDPQIWSNTRFRICMRVQDKSDSNEVIKCNDAAYLKQTGRFYFQVGYNEVFVLGQAAWAGGKYIPAEKVNKTIDTKINFINNVGYSIKDIDTKEKKELVSTANGEELINIVKYLSNLAKEQNIKCKPLWLEKIPEFIKVEDLASKYNYIKSNFNINPIIGEYDVPKRQEQKLLTLPLSDEGNAVVFGASGSGKENFITTLIYSSLLNYTPEEINYYIIDFGSGALKMFDNCPIVGNILNIEDEEKIENLYKLLISTIEERKKLFEEYNGEYENYCKNSGKTVPNIVVVINNFESYQEIYGKFEETLNILSRDCNKYGIYFLITVNTPSGIRLKLKQNFSLTYVLQQNNEDDYSTILGNVRKTYPAKIFGRGIIKIDDIYEFQIALATERDSIAKFIKGINEEYNMKYQIRTKKIPVLPKIIGFNEISKEFGKSNDLIIGINKKNLEICKFNFNKNFATIVSSLDLSASENFINCLINQIIAINNSTLIVINADDYNIEDKYKTFYQYVDRDFNKVFTTLNDFSKTQSEKFKSSNFDKIVFKDVKPIYCVIIGVDNFKNRLNEDNKLLFPDIFMNSKETGIINYILVDSIDKIKKIEFETWYKNCINSDSGIWIGNGINDQFNLRISQKIDEMKLEVPDGFCFVINRGKATYVKYVSELNLKTGNE